MEKAHNFLKIILDSILHGLRVCLRANFKNNFFFRIKTQKNTFYNKKCFLYYVFKNKK